MDKLNSVDSRGKNRRIRERRITSRRIITHPFGSEKWVHAVEVANLMWPKQDRRLQDRRIVSRRLSERRTPVQKHRRWSVRQQPLLTAEEISMLWGME
tara:strand:+ start:2103 stop:2396 length:294 start_codon:yes stop_codon:yes gene_type:complete